MSIEYNLVIRLEADSVEDLQRVAKEMASDIDMSNAYIETPDGTIIPIKE